MLTETEELVTETGERASPIVVIVGAVTMVNRDGGHCANLKASMGDIGARRRAENGRWVAGNGGGASTARVSE